jgi:hypothetical protein
MTQFKITTFDVAGKAIAETVRNTKEGLDTVLAEVVKEMNDTTTAVDFFTVEERTI